MTTTENLKKYADIISEVGAFAKRAGYNEDTDVSQIMRDFLSSTKVLYFEESKEELLRIMKYLVN